jgi:hypothetical protein
VPLPSLYKGRNTRCKAISLTPLSDDFRKFNLGLLEYGEKRKYISIVKYQELRI